MGTAWQGHDFMAFCRKQGRVPLKNAETEAFGAGDVLRFHPNLERWQPETWQEGVPDDSPEAVEKPTEAEKGSQVRNGFTASCARRSSFTS